MSQHVYKPSRGLLRLQYKLKSLDFRLIRDEIIQHLFESGVIYDDFEVIKLTGRQYVGEEQRLSLITTQRPMPQEVYAPIIEIFNGLYPENYRSGRAMFPVKLVCETSAIKPVDLQQVEGNPQRLWLFGELWSQAQYLTEELHSWQAIALNKADFLCWSGFTPNGKEPCIFVTVSDEYVPIDDGSDVNHGENLRARVRRVLEYVY